MVTQLQELIGSQRVVLCLGAGGVGKTTIAAALAVAAAAQGRDVAVLTVDPARRLATALGLGVTGPGPTPVDLPTGSGHLSAEMLDPAMAWDELVRRELDGDAAQRLIDNAMYRAVTRRFIQSHDFIAVERLHELLETGFELVVVDTPPSARALDFLEAPSRMEAFFSMRALGWFTGTAAGPVGDLTARPFRVIADRVLGAKFVSDLIEFFALARRLSDGFAARSQQVTAQLQSATTSTVVVTAPEALPTAQAVELGEQLAARDMTWDATVANRVLPAGGRTEMGADQIVAELVSALGAAGLAEPTAMEVREFVERSLVSYDSAGATSDRQRKMVRDALGAGPPVTFLDERLVGPSDLPGLLELADDLLR